MYLTVLRTDQIHNIFARDTDIFRQDTPYILRYILHATKPTKRSQPLHKIYPPLLSLSTKPFPPRILAYGSFPQTLSLSLSVSLSLFTLPSPRPPHPLTSAISFQLTPHLLPGPPDRIPNRSHLFPRSWPRRNRSLAPSLRSPSLQSLILISLILYLFIIFLIIFPIIINIIIIRTPRPQSKRSMRNPQCQQTKGGAGRGDIGRG